MTDDIRGALRLAEVAKRCGVSVDVLKHLIESGHLSGVVRSASGHVYVSQDAVPVWADIAEVLEHRLKFHLGEAQRSASRVRDEIEAIANDLALAAEAPLERLGYDAENFDARVSGRHTFGVALNRLQADIAAVQLYNKALRRAHEVP